jgi:DNA-binding protein
MAMAKRAVKTSKPKKKATKKLRRKAKASRRVSEKPAELPPVQQPPEEPVQESPAPLVEREPGQTPLETPTLVQQPAAAAYEEAPKALPASQVETKALAEASVIEPALAPAPLLPEPEEMEALPAKPPLVPPLPEAHEEKAVQEEEKAVQEEEERAAEELPPRREVPPNHIFIGKKPIMGYALSAVMQLTQYPEVILRARGKAISRAVDVAEVILKRLGNGRLMVKSIVIDTDVVGEGAERRNISTIRISVGKAN